MKGKEKKEPIESLVFQVTLSLFEKDMNQTKVLQKLAMVSGFESHHQVSSILFSLFNLAINNHQMAYQCA